MNSRTSNWRALSNDLEDNIAQTEERLVRAILHEGNPPRHNEPSPEVIAVQTRKELKEGYTDEFDDF